MFEVLANRIYRHLFLAQVIALLGTGFATVALSLLAYELAHENAGVVLGTALTIKMIAYVFIAPVASALIRSLPRRRVLITLDLIRASVALCLPFVSEVWHVYLLIFLLQSASACFTPLFQATIPDVLDNEEQYTQALSLSRLAYDLENLLSPTLAALLLSFMTWHGLFAGTVLGFIASALLLFTLTLPIIRAKVANQGNLYQQTTQGIRRYMATPRLRGLLAMNVAVTAAGAMVIVNTVVLVQVKFGLSEQITAIAMAFFGGGSMVAALAMPTLLKRLPDRSVMLAATSLLVCGLFTASFIGNLPTLLGIWTLLGAGYALVQTPSGRLLVRSSPPEERPNLFAAQFSLSHACWLIAYPTAGFLGVTLGLPGTFLLFSGAAFIALIAACKLWPAEDPVELEHSHDGLLPPDHPHLSAGQTRHSHPYFIDELHHRWPK